MKQAVQTHEAPTPQNVIPAEAGIQGRWRGEYGFPLPNPLDSRFRGNDDSVRLCQVLSEWRF